ncbi:glutamate receptor 2.7 [Cryptomeria japonica]|uniref:glutamate receptor 2.7 n=1 Tax=Cryptomeria japonica TaxID=3369 RepID=UPI0027DA7D9F|nr:glutamate receptor 2.7 [Cryptomeria japonica]
MKRVQIFQVMCILVAASVDIAVQKESVNVGVIIDSSLWAGKIAKSAMELAVDYVNNQSEILKGAELCLHLQEAQTSLEGSSAAVDLLANEEVVALIEAQASKTEPLLSDLGEAANVPILSLSVTSPAHCNQRFPYFVRMAHIDSFQMKAVAALVNNYGWRSIAFLHSDNHFDSGAMPSLRDALRDLDSDIAYTSIIPSTAQKQTIRKELHKLKSIETRVYVVHTPFDLGMNVIMEAQKMGMMESGYVWIITQGFTSLWDYALNASTISSMQGLLGIKTHIPDSKKLNDFTQRWEQQFRLDNPNTKNIELNSYGLLAYDTVLMIAQAIGKMERNSSLSFVAPSTSLEIIANTKIKVFQQGKKLLEEIFSTNFDGLSGPVKFHDGEMVGCGYEVVNVVGKSYQTVGYWPFNSSKLFKTPSFSDEGLRSVIWPGRSVTVPRGWAIPTRLKIAVPRKAGWEEFVSVSLDPASYETIVSGFSIDVFRAVVGIVEPQLQFDFIPYPEIGIYADNYSYEELIMQVYLKKYDAVVGDVTITAN